MGAWKLKIEPWRVYWPVVADSHHFDEEQDQDPGSALKWKGGIRIRNPALRAKDTLEFIHFFIKHVET